MSISIKCPACRAENRVPGPCRRCKADLGTLWLLEQQRLSALLAMRRQMTTGEFDSALESLQVAEHIRPGQDLQRYRACLYAICGDFDSACAAYVVAQDQKDTDSAGA